MKRVVASSVISLIILLLIAGGFFYFQFYRTESTSAFQSVPSDVAFVISADPSSGDFRRLASSSFFNGSDSVPVMKAWRNALLRFDSVCVHEPEMHALFEKSPLLISGHVTGPSAFSLLFIMTAGNDLSSGSEQIVRKLLLGKGTVTERNYNGTIIRDISSDYGYSFSWAISKGIFIGSTTPYLVEDALRQQRAADNPSPAADLANYVESQSKDMVVAIRYAGFAKWLRTQFREPDGVGLAGLERLGNWSVMKVEPHVNVISFDGQTTLEDSVSFLRVFAQQQPVERKLIDWLPAKTAGAVVWGASDPTLLLESLRKYRSDGKSTDPGAVYMPYFRDWLGEEMALVVTQPVGTPGDNNYIALLAVKDSLKAESGLKALAGSEGQQEELYNGYTIRYINKKSVLSALFGSLFHRVNRFYYTRINHHLVIANQAGVLRVYINDVKTGNLLTKQDRYQSLAARVPVRGNLFFYCSIPQSEKLFSSIAAPAWVQWLAEYGEVLQNWNGLAFSIGNSNGRYLTSGCLGYFDASANGPQLAWNVKLDTLIDQGPYLPNGSNGLIFATDQLRQLYAFDADGNLKWKKKLETPMMSAVYAVDFHSNGQHQYLFSTHSFVYVLDSLGQNVSNYPIRLPAEASAGLTFVAAQNGNAGRYYIPCTNLRLFAYEVNGKPLSGFSILKLPDIISTPVFIHPLTGDLVLLDQKGTAFVADKTGSRKFTFRKTISMQRDANFFLLKGDEAYVDYLDAEGRLFRVSAEGEVNEAPIGSSGDTTLHIAFCDLNGDEKDDILIGGPEGVYAKTDDGVNIFKYKSEGGFLSVSGVREAGRKYVAAIGPEGIYLMNHDGTPVEGFPLPSASLPVTGLNDEGALLLLTRGGADNISLFILP